MGGVHLTVTTEVLKSQFATSKKGRGGRRYNPYVFTEQGVAMLSSVLRSKRAVEAKPKQPFGFHGKKKKDKAKN